MTMGVLRLSIYKEKEIVWGQHMGLDYEQERAIEKLYREMYRTLYVYAENALGNRQLAEEAVQDTFRIACAKAEAMLDSPNPKGWLVNTLKYVILNMRRSQARLNALVVSALSLDELEIPVEEEGLGLATMYAGLVEEKDLRLLELLALKRYSMLEAANEFGISVEACKKRVQRARKKLVKILEKND